MKGTRGRERGKEGRKDNQQDKFYKVLYRHKVSVFTVLRKSHITCHLHVKNSRNYM